MIRNARIQDIDEIIRVYESAREFMHTHGNPTQWAGEYPDRETLIKDIQSGQLYVVINDCNVLFGCFALIPGNDPTYDKIYEGEWLNDNSYAAIHRIASDRTQKGVFKQCLEFSRKLYNHLRIDTHKDNIPMQNAAKKFGFGYRGIIYLADGSPRIAFEWTK